MTAADERVDPRHEEQTVRRLLDLGPGVPVQFVDTGWMSRVHLVDGGRYVVKFPRRTESRAELAVDVAALGVIGQVAGDVLLPRVVHVHPDYDHVVYEGVPGVGLDAAGDLGEATCRLLGEAVGRFLSRMHPLRLPGERTLRVEDEVGQLHRAYRRGRPALVAALGAGAVAALDTLVGAELPALLLELGHDPGLAHGDLGPWNMILAPGRQLGVIDFGDAGRWDRSKDFMALEPAPLRAAALDAYGAEAHLRRKVEARRPVLLFLDLPYFVETGDAARADETIRRIAGLVGEAPGSGDSRPG